MRKLYENFHIFHFQKTIVSAENFHENMVCGCISQLIIVPGSMYCLHYAKFFFNFCWTDETFTILLIRDMVVERWNRRFSCETIHPTQKFISMNWLQMSCMITWTWFTCEVVEADRGQKHHILVHTLAL